MAVVVDEHRHCPLLVELLALNDAVGVDVTFADFDRLARQADDAFDAWARAAFGAEYGQFPASRWPASEGVRVYQQSLPAARGREVERRTAGAAIGAERTFFAHDGQVGVAHEPMAAVGASELAMRATERLSHRPRHDDKWRQPLRGVERGRGRHREQADGERT
jgi:hypothetical protein